MHLYGISNMKGKKYVILANAYMDVGGRATHGDKAEASIQ